MTEQERWIDSKLVFEIIEFAKNGKWRWSRNHSCKYIEVRIDMRDGHCLVRNRHGDEISIDELRNQ